MRVFIFLSLLTACGSFRSTPFQETTTAEYQKSIAGYSGARQLSFYLELPADSTTVLNRFVINGEELGFTSQYTQGHYILRAEKEYCNPERDTECTLTGAEFNQAPLYSAQHYEAAVYYTRVNGKSGAWKISYWTAKNTTDKP